MKSLLAVIAASLVFTIPAYAGDLTVEQCLSILTGLNALNCAGQQMGGSCEPAAKQYKLGDARMSIAQDVAALAAVAAIYQRTIQGHQLEYDVLPPAPTDQKPDPFAVDRAKQNRDFVAFQNKELAKTCPLSGPLVHLHATDLKIGDGTDKNEIPPGVLAAISPIVDK